MFRRLHLDEAHRASYLRAPAKEGENQENQEQSDLALEFSRLLDQVQGPMAAVHDEVMALGLALAQAIPLMQQNRQDVREQSVNVARDDQSSDDSGQSDDSSALDNNEADVGDRLWVSSRDDSSRQATQARVDTTDDKTSSDYGTQVEENDQSNQNTQTDAVMDLLSVEDTTGSEVVIQVAEVQVVDEQTLAVEQEVDFVSQEFVDSGAKNSSQSGLDIPGLQASLTEVKTSNNEGHSKDEEEDDASDAEVDFISTAEVLANSDDIHEVKKQKPAGEKPPVDEIDTKAEVPTTESTPQAAPKDHQDSRVLRKGVNDETGLFENRIQKQNEAIAKLSQLLKKEGDEFSNHAGLDLPKSAETKVDSAFQLTLLRQAFESLKAHRSETGENKQRSVMPQVTGAGTVAETRATSSEVGSKGSKHLSKATTQRMLERVEATLKEAARSRDGKTISLRLDPAQLGRVKVDVSLREGTLHARITPENQQVMVSLREHAHELQGALRKLGLNVDSVTVTVSYDPGQESSDFGRELNNGKSYQEERHNMPQETGQVVENTFGNELAELAKVGPQQATEAISDHWVA